ncbi:putative bifunctional diguanylate cyclase/phosphodiesterase [Geoalkalibacter halelectricus]|uniref:EAL domain-containing protein n=1 Tax=Geoalkalibacter halelectricus TaxID=2847045 RepID=A0ABY5ZTC2_9BACT|nr:EAL domain-containing protein [Geoalkalibacter halelectricus]MDO3376886.1 EAL domain-containing protein [Geoalkalibacter halelectricus]UWZ81110.1 EAL domain-containing protein [Geoalkalibacter halelectricus]
MNTPAATGKHGPPPALILLFLILAGLAGNIFAPRLFMGFNYLFGSIAVLLILRIYGLRWSLVAAMVAASATLWLFHHPFAMLWLGLEPLFIGLLLRRRPEAPNLVLFSALYWTLVGVPLIFLFFLGVQGASLGGTLPAAMMYWLIGVTNALAASLLLNIRSFAGLLGLRKSLQTLSLRQVVFNLLMAAVVGPAILIMVLNGRIMETQSHDLALKHIEDMARLAPLEIEPAMGRNPQSDALQQALAALANSPGQGTIVSVKNTLGNILASSHPAMRPAGHSYNPFEGCEKIPVAPGIFQALPRGDIPIPLWQRVQRSSLVLEAPLPSAPAWVLVIELPLGPLKQRLLERQTFALALVLGLIVLALINALFFSRWLALPLLQLSQVTTNLPARISARARITYPQTRIAEVDRLIGNFKVMDEVLQDKFREITEAKETLEQRVQERTEELKYLATHDPLTHLPNRGLLLDRLSQALALQSRHGKKLGLLLLDLDNFKMVNDTLGHSTGDLLLQQVAHRLQEGVRQMDTVARLGGDEFVILAAEVESLDAMGKIAQKLLENFSAPFHLNGRELFITASLGITIHPDDGRQTDILLKNADTAMYQAKKLGKNTFQFFTREMDQRIRKRLDLETRLRRALERNEFLLHYQPQVELSSGRVTGVEGLLRWCKDGGEILVPPREFIPILEETGLIVPVGEWVLQTAVAQARQWELAGLAPLQLAVNISARQFYRESLPEKIHTILEQNGFSSSRLTLEITESILLQDTGESLSKLRTLKDMGINIAIDDFGTGYSSLAYLKRLPIDELKIDRVFVEGMTEDPKDAALIEAIIELARKLGMKVVAEGVETAEQLDFISRRGCEKVQGFFLSRPLPAAGVEELLKAHFPGGEDRVGWAGRRRDTL